MKIQLLKENLHQAVNVASRFTTSKAQLPVLSHLALTAEEGGIFLSGTDLLVGVRLRIGGKVVDQGGVALPAKLLGELVSSMPMGTVEIETDETDVAQVRVGNMAAKVSGLSLSEFPPIAAEGGVKMGELSVGDLAEIVAKIGFSVSADDSRPVLTGIQWEIGNRFVSTDGFRLSLTKDKLSEGLKVESLEKLLISGSFLKEASRVLEEFQEKIALVFYDKDKKQITLQAGDLVLTGRVLGGEFPDYRAILPTASDLLVEVDRRELLQAVKSAAIFARDSANIVKLAIKDDGIQVSANAPQIGENVVVTQVLSMKGSETVIAFNSRYLSDFLTHVEKDVVVLKFTGPLKPGLFQEKGNEDYSHVIMPVRIRGEE